jgi:stearoyl-CoA desaturase (delta-9 desaturase)
MNKILNSIYLWLDAEAIKPGSPIKTKSISWVRCLPFIATHLACLAAFWVNFSSQAILVCFLSYFVRMFAITGFYHRYFSHRSFKTSRFMQFIFAILGSSAAQRGPLWWSAHHRFHHKHSDQRDDPHSPKQHGFLWSHFGWFIDEENFPTEKQSITDLIKYPELVFLNRYDVVVPLLYALMLYFIGGWQYVIWGYFISTVILYHATFLINSLAHTYGKQKFDTGDDSRNNWWLALITLGEGWHNNHHYWPSSARQGFHFKEVDITYFLLKCLEKVGLIWSLRTPPKEVANVR